MEAVRAIPVRRCFDKFSITRVERTFCECPNCGELLNAGPNYQPGFCSECGQKVHFEGIVWEPDKFLGFVKSNDDNELILEVLNGEEEL